MFQLSSISKRFDSTDAVRAMTWLASDDTIWCALANVEADDAQVEIQVLPPGLQETAQLEVTRVGPDEEARLADSVAPGTWPPLTLAPYEVACLRVEPVAARQHP